ncbi:MAG: thiol:disulfide interchange protein [Acidobacteria bacterium SCN 69-37]|nr:MAG: thiol:disulfide interchange protein [Acidobacteria bacterium SCN 69-37]
MILDDFLQRFGASLPHASAAALLVTVIAGVLASAVCPCTVPVGIGVATAAGGSEIQERRSGVLMALAFFAGIVINLTILGALAGQLGAFLTESFGRYWALVMAVLSLGAAVVAFIGPRLKVHRLANLRRPGISGAFVYGFIFSLGTSAAPLLVLLTISAAQARAEYGLLLAFVFGVGRGLPFLIVGLFAGLLMRFAALSRWRRPLQVVSGGALLTVAVYYVRAFTTLL